MVLLTFSAMTIWDQSIAWIYHFSQTSNDVRLRESTFVLTHLESTSMRSCVDSINFHTRVHPMKYIFLFAILMMALGTSAAQTKIYSANGSYKGSLSYIVDGPNVYYANGSYKGKLAFISDGDKLYSANGSYKGDLAFIFDGDRIFTANGSYKGSLYMIIDGDNAYYANGSYKGKLAFIKDGDKVYYANGSYKGKMAAIVEGGLTRALLFVLLNN